MVITGAPRDLGGIWAEAALKCGNKVTATARTRKDVADLSVRFGDAVLSQALDVTDPAQLQQVFGRHTRISASWTYFSTMPAPA